VLPHNVFLLRGAPCGKRSLKSSSVTFACSPPHLSFARHLVVAVTGVDVTSDKDSQGGAAIQRSTQSERWWPQGAASHQWARRSRS